MTNTSSQQFVLNSHENFKYNYLILLYCCDIAKNNEGNQEQGGPSSITQLDGNSEDNFDVSNATRRGRPR